MNIPFFGDIGWFYLSAREAILSGKFPLLGITSSIVWLHQGPLWTYMLIPAFWMSNFHPLSPVIFNIILIIFLISNFYFLISKLFNKSVAFLSTLILVFNPWVMMHLRTPYHTAPIPLFEVIFFLCIIKQRDFLAGLFLGFLYQLHLLTFIFWPLVIFRLRLRLLAGFLLGIIPFIIAGPTQTFGIFVWLIKNLFTGFSGAGLNSEAYKVVLFIPCMLLFSLFLHKLPKLLKIFVVVVVLAIGHLSFDINRYAPFYPPQPVLGKPIFPSATMPFEYYQWWLNRVK